MVFMAKDNRKCEDCLILHSPENCPKMKKELLNKIDKIVQKYFYNMQLQMQRFANEIMELKFKEEDEN